MTRIRVSPVTCAFPDENGENLNIEVELPGVKKDNIKFSMLEDSFYIDATKNDIEYKGSYVTCCPVKPSEAIAKYDNGLLKVTVPYKDSLEDAVEVQIE